MKESRRVVCDAGPLISLEQLPGGYDFIRRLYEKLVVPLVVLEEVAYHHSAVAAYIEAYQILDLLEIREVTATTPPLPEEARLHQGEVEAIRLALELELPLLIEEAVGRRVAQAVGIQISGIAGQIVKAFRLNVISAEEAKQKLVSCQP